MKLVNTLIVLVAVFFCVRELGTFPSAWLDDSLFMLVAQSVVRGDGYSLPMMSEHWYFPFVLAVGPTVILPSALSMSVLGESVAVARIPAVLYTLATVVALFVFAKERGKPWNAQMAALLLITLSAFVNNGKPLLGEVPAIFYLLCGLLALQRAETYRAAALAGVLLGLSAVSKLTFGIIFPALGVAFIVCVLRKETLTAYRLMLAGCIAFVIFIAWQVVEFSSNPASIYELRYYGFADDGTQLFHLLRTNPAHLLRFPFLYFGALITLGSIGMRLSRHTMRNGVAPFVIALVVLFGLYFLNGPGWYRHLLPAHVLLLPFVPLGAWSFFGKRIGTALLVFFIFAQGWWQLTYHGATKSPEAENAAAAVLALDMPQFVIEQPEVYFRLPDSDRYLFSSREFIRDYLDFGLPFTQEEHCLPVVRKVGPEERESYGKRLTPLDGRYVLIAPPEACAG